MIKYFKVLIFVLFVIGLKYFLGVKYKMLCIRERRFRSLPFDLSLYTLFELIKSYWMEMKKWEPRWRFYWWKADFKIDFIETMEKEWPTCELFISKIDSLKSDFDPTLYNAGSESYFSHVMKIVDGLRKKN